MKKILLVFGTRPEAIKMAPLVKAFESNNQFECRVCVTAQHRQMLDQVLQFFDIKPHYDLDIMQAGQTLTDVTSRCLLGLQPILTDFKPDLVFAQGDTTTVLATALAATYNQIPFAHLEAGLRSGNKLSPFPEEYNRIVAGHLATYHFAPTRQAKQNLAAEGITHNVHVVGNTVIDALLLGLNIIKNSNQAEYADFFNFVDFNKRVILVTGHRRESFGQPFENLCQALAKLADRGDVQIVYPVHLNPNVQEPVKRILGDRANIHLIEPLSYPYLIWLMQKAHLVITDSGGIQEEAPSLGKPVLVMRDVTERTEGIEAGTAKLVGTNTKTIITQANRLLDDEVAYQKMAQATNPYGDGNSSKRIADILAGN